MTNKLYLYPFWLRLWHWSNAALFLMLIVTGASMHYASPHAHLIPFRTAVLLHNVSGITLSFLYAGYVVASIWSGNIRHYLPRLRGILMRLVGQTRYYVYGIFAGEPHPTHPSMENKFNPLQQITYLNIMYGLLPLLILTGWFLLFPERSPDRILGAGGVWPIAVLHTLLGFFGALFMIGHMYLATTGSTVLSNFKGMWTGWHDEDSH